MKEATRGSGAPITSSWLLQLRKGKRREITEDKEEKRFSSAQVWSALQGGANPSIDFRRPNLARCGDAPARGPHVVQLCTLSTGLDHSIGAPLRFSFKIILKRSPRRIVPWATMRKNVFPANHTPHAPSSFLGYYWRCIGTCPKRGDEPCSTCERKRKVAATTTERRPRGPGSANLLS